MPTSGKPPPPPRAAPPRAPSAARRRRPAGRSAAGRPQGTRRTCTAAAQAPTRRTAAARAPASSPRTAPAPAPSGRHRSRRGSPRGCRGPTPPDRPRAPEPRGRAPRAPRRRARQPSPAPAPARARAATAGAAPPTSLDGRHGLSLGRRPGGWTRGRGRDPVVAAELSARPGDEVAVAGREVRFRRGPLVGRTRRESGLQRSVVGPAEGGVALRIRLRLPPGQEAREGPPRAKLGQGASGGRGAPARPALGLLAVDRRRRGSRPTRDGDPPHDRDPDHDQREEERDLRPTHGRVPSAPSGTPIQPASRRARNGAAPGSPGPRTVAGTS